MENINVVVELKTVNGESPIWDSRTNVLWWTDTNSKNIYSYDPKTKQNRVYTVDKTVRSVAKANKDLLVLVTSKDISLWKIGDKKTTFLCSPEKDKDFMSPSDGTVDPFGRFIFDTYNAKVLDDTSGSIYVVDKNKIVTKIDTGLALPNGIAFSPDGKVMYVAEMFKNRILSYKYDENACSDKKVLVDIDLKDGYPDGIVVDAEGYIWVGHWCGWKVMRFNPKGKIDKIFDMPFPIPTCVGFGDRNMSTLYITTATNTLSDYDLWRSYSSGSLFKMQTKYKGLKENTYKVNV